MVHLSSFNLGSGGAHVSGRDSSRGCAAAGGELRDRLRASAEDEEVARELRGRRGDSTAWSEEDGGRAARYCCYWRLVLLIGERRGGSTEGAGREDE